MTEREIDRDKQRVLEYLRSSRKFMPYLHESMPAHGAVKLLGNRDRAQRALVALVQDRQIRYLENCSPDHYQAYAEAKAQPPWVETAEPATAEPQATEMQRVLSVWFAGLRDCARKITGQP